MNRGNKEHEREREREKLAFPYFLISRTRNDEETSVHFSLSLSSGKNCQHDQLREIFLTEYCHRCLICLLSIAIELVQSNLLFIFIEDKYVVVTKYIRLVIRANSSRKCPKKNCCCCCFLVFFISIHMHFKYFSKKVPHHIVTICLSHCHMGHSIV